MTYCPACGHGVHMHRANTIDQRHALDDPVPCFYAVYTPPTDGDPPYRLCGCTHLIQRQLPIGD